MIIQKHCSHSLFRFTDATSTNETFIRVPTYHVIAVYLEQICHFVDSHIRHYFFATSITLVLNRIQIRKQLKIET